MTNSQLRVVGNNGSYPYNYRVYQSPQAMQMC